MTVALTNIVNSGGGLGYDRQALGCDRQALGYDRQALGYDRQAIGYDRQAIGYDRQAIGSALIAGHLCIYLHRLQLLKGCELGNVKALHKRGGMEGVRSSRVQGVLPHSWFRYPPLIRATLLK